MIKKIVFVIISVGVGSFVDNILEKTEINVWLARGTGGLVTVIIALLLYYLLIKKS
ncbi:hypothetical protein LL037_12330 [Clostridium estertheticum]|uniref:Uncharacterized protein n=1 Tax=Clostridium estertheticum TaxID=238834 RepID=A0AA47ELY3_9CLOT|nr:hypothetical protein [Clostridium estertheticum]MBU3156893.1 hypothetical protein [Clostridium estertheticum]MBU3201626.1 hypothetical protein [Clostridium estertheticum]WAG62626.1 hypothetical protein LL038_10485 [Clostridium estertheticum]WAG67874.1 hypothetical protein LL037_12330 [Clostridium estertheticum]